MVIAVDYMHGVLLGVTKQLLIYQPAFFSNSKYLVNTNNVVLQRSFGSGKYTLFQKVDANISIN